MKMSSIVLALISSAALVADDDQMGLLLKDLKSGAPEVRLRALQKIGEIGPKASILGEPVVEAMLDPLQSVRDAAAETLEKIEPAIHPHVFQLLRGQDKAKALRSLEKLGPEAKHALPALIFFYRENLKKAAMVTGVVIEPDPTPLKLAVKLAPSDKRVAALVLGEIASPRPPINQGGHYRRRYALQVLGMIDVENKEKVASLAIALQDEAHAVLVIEALEAIGKDADPALPALRKLKLSSDDAIRIAATKAVATISAP